MSWLSVAIPALCRFINYKDGRGQLTSFYATHYKNAKIRHNKSRGILFYGFFPVLLIEN